MPLTIALGPTGKKSKCLDSWVIADTFYLFLGNVVIVLLLTLWFVRVGSGLWLAQCTRSGGIPSAKRIHFHAHPNPHHHPKSVQIVSSQIISIRLAPPPNAAHVWWTCRSLSWVNGPYVKFPSVYPSHCMAGSPIEPVRVDTCSPAIIPTPIRTHHQHLLHAVSSTCWCLPHGRWAWPAVSQSVSGGRGQAHWRCCQDQ